MFSARAGARNILKNLVCLLNKCRGIDLMKCNILNHLHAYLGCSKPYPASGRDAMQASEEGKINE
jgi:hypothetical protein